MPVKLRRVCYKCVALPGDTNITRPLVVDKTPNRRIDWQLALLIKLLIPNEDSRFL